MVVVAAIAVAVMRAVVGKGSEGGFGIMAGSVLASQKSQFPTPKELVSPAKAKLPSPVTTREKAA